jgi:hypothetical protein
VRGICGTSHKSSKVVKHRLSQFFFTTLNKIITHYRWLADHFYLQCEHLFTHLSLNILQHCLAIPSLMFLAWRKCIIVQISKLAGLSITGHTITLSVETRTNTRCDQFYDGLQKHWVMLPRMHKLSLAPTLFAQNKQRLLS